MVKARFVNDTTQIDIHSESQVKSVGMKLLISHANTRDRDLPDQHTIGAITGLQEALDDCIDEAELEAALLEKQDIIRDLSEIREGASAGATAVQPSELESYATKEYVDGELESYATKEYVDGELESYATKDYVDNGLSGKQDTLTAGANIQIVGNTIFATDTTYTAGTGIDITNGVISNTQTSAIWGNITGTLSAQTDLWNVFEEKANVADIPTATSDLLNDSGYITNAALVGYATESWVGQQGYLTSSALTPYALSSTLATVATSGSYDDLSDKPTIGNATLTIQKNSTDIDTFTANATVDKIINITVPTTAGDVNALSDSTKYGASIDLNLDTTNYKLTLTLKDQDGNILKSVTVDFPIESVVVNGSYDSLNQKIVLTLQNGNTIDIPVGALIAGLQTEITSINKLDADLVDDSTSTSKFVTSNEKSTWNGKQDAISDLATIRSNATNGASAYTTMQNYGNIVTHNISEFATSAQGALADSAVQPSDLATVATSGSYNDLSDKPTNVSAFTNDVGYITNSALNGYATQTWVGQQGFITGITSSDVTTALGYTPYNSSNPSGYITNAALTGYATESYVTTAVSAKQDALVSGTNIKTINNQSILGSGNIDIQGGGGIAVDSTLSLTSENPVQNKVVTQALTELSANVNMDAYLDMIIAGNTSDLPIIAQSTYSDDLDDIIGGTYDNNV